MSRRRKREAPLPASSAGLLTFFEEDITRIKLRPEFVVGLSAGLIILSIILLIF